MVMSCVVIKSSHTQGYLVYTCILLVKYMSSYDDVWYCSVLLRPNEQANLQDLMDAFFVVS